MPFAQVEDILDRFRSHHRRFAEDYRNEVGEADGEQLKLLLEHMAWHEERIDEVLRRYQDDDQGELSEAWLQNLPESDFEKLPEHPERKGAGAVGWVRGAVDANQRLIDLYRTIAERGAGQRLGELFEDLAQRVELESRELSNRLNEMRG